MKTLESTDISTPVVAVTRLGDAAPIVSEQRTDPLIMVIDDEPINIKVVCRLLQMEGYTNFITNTDPAQAVDLIATERPDLVLLDLMMPGISGVDILNDVRALPSLRPIPIVILTAATDRESRLGALEAGATDFITKPVDPSELSPRVKNILAVKQSYDQLENYSHDLEEAVRQRTADLEQSQLDVIHCLARAAEYRDDDTGQHVLRVGKYARLIGEELGFDQKLADRLEQAAQLHDVGKIGVPDSVLLKNGKLTEEEFSLMKKHCDFGSHILPQIDSGKEQSLRKHANTGAAILEVGSSRLLALAATIALTHHEWWDGTGYPMGLAGEDIPLEGRITAVADVFDALSSKRCYKDAFPLETCFKIIAEERGTHFDPEVVDAFFRRQSQIINVKSEYSSDA